MDPLDTLAAYYSILPALVVFGVLMGLSAMLYAMTFVTERWAPRVYRRLSDVMHLGAAISGCLAILMCFTIVMGTVVYPKTSFRWLHDMASVAPDTVRKALVDAHMEAPRIGERVTMTVIIPATDVHGIHTPEQRFVKTMSWDDALRFRGIDPDGPEAAALIPSSRIAMVP
jgi:hypothetical protein